MNRFLKSEEYLRFECEASRQMRCLVTLLQREQIAESCGSKVTSKRIRKRSGHRRKNGGRVT